MLSLRLLLCTLLLAPMSFLFGQTAAGEINGTITDKSGGAVPNAVVKLINEGTQIQSQTQTNASGYSLFINVQPGTYD